MIEYSFKIPFMREFTVRFTRDVYQIFTEPSYLAKDRLLLATAELS